MFEQQENLEEKKAVNKDIMLFKSVSIVDKYNFYEYLSVMIDSWVTISEALNSVSAKIRNPFFKMKIEELLTYINSWDAFSKAMKKIPQVFTSWEISMVESGETSWMLVTSLSRLSNDLRRNHELRAKVKWALTYPIIIFLFLILAVIVVLSYVIPSLRPLFAESWVELPFATKTLIWTSDFLINNYLVILLFLFFLFVIFVWYRNTSEWKAKMNNILLSLPLVWKVYQNYILASASATLWNLVWSWVNITKALSLTWKATNSIVYESLFNAVMTKVSGGNKIVDSMREVDEYMDYFPHDFLQMLSVWEKTAKVEEIANKMNIQYTREVDYSLASLTKWIEPIAILLAWIFVLWFAFAIFWAILKVTQTVS